MKLLDSLHGQLIYPLRRLSAGSLDPLARSAGPIH